MFSLLKKKALLSSVNCRAENHGEDKVLGVDMKFLAKVSNDELIEFDPTLKSFLFKEADSGQEELALEDATRMSALRFPNMGSIGWKLDLTGYAFKLHYGVGAKSDVKLIDCKVNSFRFTPQEGGSVEVSFRVQANPLPAEMPRILEYIQKEAEIDLLPPEEQTEEQMDLAA